MGKFGRSKIWRVPHLIPFHWSGEAQNSLCFHDCSSGRPSFQGYLTCLYLSHWFRWPDGHKWQNIAKMAIYVHLAIRPTPTPPPLEFLRKFLQFRHVWNDESEDPKQCHHPSITRNNLVYYEHVCASRYLTLPRTNMRHVWNYES